MTMKQQNEKNNQMSNLESYENSITGSVSALIAHKQALNTIKTNMVSKPTMYTAAEVTECDDLITSIATQIATI